MSRTPRPASPAYLSVAVAATRPSRARAVKRPCVPRSRTVRIGDNIFINADAVKGAIRHLPDNSVDLIITDPPYGINGDQLHAHYNRDEHFVVGQYIEVPAARYKAFSREWIAQAERVLRPGGQLYVVSGYTHLHHVLNALRQTSLREINHIIWKYNFGVYTSTKFVSSHYHVLYYAKPGGKRTFNLQSRFSTTEKHAAGGSANYRDREDVWIINREYKRGQQKNKNELPRALLQKMLQYSSREADVVCDFFMGSCSTAAVAIGLNRRFIGFELSKPTFDRFVPQIKQVVPGELLASISSPTPHAIENCGKPWTESEVQSLLSRSRALPAEGLRKRDILTALCAEFQRGPFAIQKVLKQRASAIAQQRRGAA